MRNASRGRLSLGQILEVGDGDHTDSNGLTLRVRASAASWVFRYTSPVHAGRRREIGLGAACRNDREQAESAARNARALAMEFAAAVIKGIDPKDTRDSEKAARQAESFKQAQQKITTKSDSAMPLAISSRHFLLGRIASKSWKTKALLTLSSLTTGAISAVSARL